ASPGFALGAGPTSVIVDGHWEGPLRIEVGDRAWTTDGAPSGVVVAEPGASERVRLISLDGCRVLAAFTARGGDAYRIALSDSGAAVRDLGAEAAVDLATRWTETDEPLACQPSTDAATAPEPAPPAAPLGLLAAVL